MEKQQLTRRQRNVYDFIVRFYADNNFMPTQGDMASYFNIKVGGSTFYYIRQLVKKGYLERLVKHTPGGLRIVE